MILTTYFADFLKRIRLPKLQVDALIEAHKTLRERLGNDEALAPRIISTFLQGSYRRSTLVKPEPDSAADVDVVVVTNLPEALYTPQQALEVFRPFLIKHYLGRYKFQGRSICIDHDDIDLDLVVTSAPTEAYAVALKSASARTVETLEEAEDWRFNKYWLSSDQRQDLTSKSSLYLAAQNPEWKSESLRIPDRDAECWQDTDPLTQIRWTYQKNRDTNKYFVNVVKALKWWRRVNHSTPKRPKSYPLEHLIGDCCPDNILSVAEGVVGTLEEIKRRYADDVGRNQTPVLPDRGVQEDVFKRIEPDDFAEFYQQACDASVTAKEALDEQSVYGSAHKWRKLFGDEFPESPESDDGGDKSASGGFTPRTNLGSLPGGRFG